MFDPRNPWIIVCNRAMEKALDVHALHYHDLVRYILKEMIFDNPNDQLTVSGFIKLHNSWRMNKSPQMSLPFWAIGCISSIPDKKTLPVVDRFHKYKVTTKCLEFIRNNNESFANETMFTLDEICATFTAFIMRRKNDLFDLRNIRVLDATDTFLEFLFDCNYIDRSQINTLIVSNIIINGAIKLSDANVINKRPPVFKMYKKPTHVYNLRSRKLNK